MAWSRTGPSLALVRATMSIMVFTMPKTAKADSKSDAVRHDVTRLGDQDLYLFNEGSHLRLHEKLGSHLTTVDGEKGCYFAVWAPNARRVSVVGDWNGWDGRFHPMRLHPGPGIWELFVPDLGDGVRYKFEILAREGGLLALKADPYAFEFELEEPRTASVVAALDGHVWDDGAWMAERARRNALDAPNSIYEVHLGSWRRVPQEPRWTS